MGAVRNFVRIVFFYRFYTSYIVFDARFAIRAKISQVKYKVVPLVLTYEHLTECKYNSTHFNICNFAFRPPQFRLQTPPLPVPIRQQSVWTNRQVARCGLPLPRIEVDTSVIHHAGYKTDGNIRLLRLSFVSTVHTYLCIKCVNLTD